MLYKINSTFYHVMIAFTQTSSTKKIQGPNSFLDHLTKNTQEISYIIVIYRPCKMKIIYFNSIFKTY